MAVLDTGVWADHLDLAGQVLPGYDMVSDVATANDGDGRDADASDPGDWITAAENASGTFKNCGVDDSSWHGTKISGIVGAAANNGQGMAGTAFGVRILPVRVLGKCGGFDSDIQAGMRWAAGLNVPGAPINPNPARVVNLSLGGSGVCDAASGYPRIIAELAAAGTTVVAAAGNSAGRAVELPANCPGVIAVAGLAPCRLEGRLFRSRAGNRDQRTGRQLHQHRRRRALPVPDPEQQQQRHAAPERRRVDLDRQLQHQRRHQLCRADRGRQRPR